LLAVNDGLKTRRVAQSTSRSFTQSSSDLSPQMIPDDFKAGD